MAVRQAYVHSELNGTLLPMKILSHFALFFSPKKSMKFFSSDCFWSFCFVFFLHKISVVLFTHLIALS